VYTRCASLLTIIFLAGCFISTDTLAQAYAVDRGSFVIGGGTSFSRSAPASTFSRERRTGVSIHSQAQYFIAARLAVGGSMVLGSSTHGDRGRNMSTGVGPAFSYYFGHDESTVLPSVGTSALYVASDQQVFRGVTSIGLTVLITRHVAFSGEWFLGADLASTRAEVVGLQLGVRVFAW